MGIQISTIAINTHKPCVHFTSYTVDSNLLWLGFSSTACPAVSNLFGLANLCAISANDWQWLHKTPVPSKHSRPCLNVKTIFPGIRIPIMNIKTVMGLYYPCNAYTAFDWKRGTWSHFIDAFSTTVQIWWKLHFPFTELLINWSLQNFARLTYQYWSRYITKYGIIKPQSVKFWIDHLYHKSWASVICQRLCSTRFTK